MSRVAGLKESFKQRAWSAPFMAFSYTAFIIGIKRVRGLNQSSKNRNVPGLHPSFKSLSAFISGINRVAGINPSFKQHAWSALFMAFSLTEFNSGLSRVRGLKQS